MRLPRFIVLILCVCAISRTAQADRIDDLIRQLRRDPDYKVRLSAALNLGKLGDRSRQKAVPALIDALRDSDKTVRGVAAAALGKLADASVGPEILATAVRELDRVSRSDSDSFVRSQAKKSHARLKAILDGGGEDRSDKGGVYVEIGPMSDATKKGGKNLAPLMRTTVTDTLARKAPSFLMRWPNGRSPTKSELERAGAKGAFYIDGTLKDLTVKKAGTTAEISCNVSLVLATYPDKSMFGFLKGGAAVQTGASQRDIDSGKQDCVGAVVEDLVGRQAVPTIQNRLP